MTATESFRRFRFPTPIVFALSLIVSLPALLSLHPSLPAPASSAAVVDPAVRAFHSGDVPVIVQKTSESTRAPERAIARLGGKITLDLPIVDGFAATIP